MGEHDYVTEDHVVGVATCHSPRLDAPWLTEIGSFATFGLRLSARCRGGVLFSTTLLRCPMRCFGCEGPYCPVLGNR